MVLKARALLGLGQHDQASKIASLVLRQEPHNVEALFVRGKVRAGPAAAHRCLALVCITNCPLPLCRRHCSARDHWTMRQHTLRRRCALTLTSRLRGKRSRLFGP